MENNKSKKNDCYGCEKRQVGCHSKCESYIQFKKELQEIKRRKREEDIIYGYQKEKRERYLKKHSELRGRN